MTGPLADPRRVLRSIIALTVVLVAVLGATASAVGAQAPAQQRSQDELRQQLAERFAPIMMLKQQEEACSTDGEQYRPGSIDIVLDNPEIALRQVGRSDPVVKRAPSAADLFGLGEGFFLDFPGNSLTPGCIYERDFRKYTGDRPATIYAHVVRQPDEPDLVFVQYWFYWYYNDWNNKHESDWEGITLKFEASSVEQALQSEPVAVGYSQHEGGERASWDDSKLEREGDRPVVYSSAGSHASYFGSALYLGRAASEGFGCDNTSGPSERVDPEVILLPDSVSDPGDP
ncbi:MAG: Vps62-related protein, partial [Acidimicrobiia bacterium]|nr:Vps62-related protein [Acidimicrobiia bacterium]